ELRSERHVPRRRTSASRPYRASLSDSSAYLRQDGLGADYAIGGRGEVGSRKRGDAAQLVTAGMAWITLEEETHIGIALAFVGGFGNAGTQAILVRTGAHDSNAGVISSRELSSCQGIDHFLRPGRR